MTMINSNTAMGTMSSAKDLAAQQAPVLATKVAGAKGVSMAKINAVAQDFEAQFISQMMESMFSTIDKKGDDITSSDAEDTFQTLMNNEYGKIIARTGGIGLASQIKTSMLRMQEVKAQGENNAPVPTPAA